jgi:hypothetical protein
VTVPAAITDLAAQQSGKGVRLTFTLPTKTAEGEPLTQPPDVEVLRGLLPSDPAAMAKPLEVLLTVPAALLDTYTSDGRMTFTDPIKPEDLAAFAGRTLVYRIRTRVSKRRASEPSHAVSLRLFPIAQAIADLSAKVTEPAIELRWSPPERLVTGAPVASLAGYRIYRAEVAPTGDAEEPVLLGLSPSPGYRDVQFEFGRTYTYTVRSVTQFETHAVESDDSNLVRVEARDTFAPAAPLNLVAVPVAAVADVPSHIELSWGISQETDVAGYRVYRMEASADSGTPGERLNAELLPVPAFRDMSVAAGRGYRYTVTVVDRAGNESASSAPVSVTVPK